MRVLLSFFLVHWTSGCSEGQTCTGDSCFIACNTDSDCGSEVDRYCGGGACRTSTCGDGEVEGREACDLGTLNADNGPCRADCQLATCGDALVYLTVEECDDGNTAPGDGCSPACTVECEPFAAPAGRCDGIMCTDDAECVNVCIGGACARISSAGGPCDDGADCDTNLECASGACRLSDGQLCTDDIFCANTCINGACAPLSATGQPCDGPPDCAAISSCTMGACVALAGVPCGYNRDCSDVCVLGFCAPRAGTGAPCDEVNDCQAGHACVDRSCLRVNGESCTSNAQCVATCRTTCAPVVGAGGSCDDDGDCIPGHTCNGSTCVKTPGARVCGDGIADPGELCFPYLVAAPSGVFHARGGDFDHDGDLDLVVVESTFFRVHVMLGNGDGTFGPPAAISPGNPQWVSVAYLSGDNHLDVAVAHYSDNRVIVHPGGGDGTFLTPTAVSVPGGPLYIEGGELTGDAAADLVVITADSDSMVILENDRAGSFSIRDEIPLGDTPRNPVLADVDGDDDLDIVVPEDTLGWINVFLNDGQGGLATPLLALGGIRPQRVALGDFTGDGDVDMAAANLVSDDISVFVGGGDGTFALTDSLPASFGWPQELWIFDIDSDGARDLAALFSDGTMATWLGDGSGGFVAQQAFTAAANATALVLGELHGDGRVDAIIAHDQSGPDVAILPGLGGGVFHSPTELSGFFFNHLSIGDVRNTGVLDVVGSRSSSTNHFRGAGDGSFSAPTVVPGGGSRVLVHDLDGDMFPDLIADEFMALNIYWNNGGTGFTAPSTVSTLDVWEITVVALDAVGGADVVALDFSGDVVIVFNDGGRSFQMPQITTSGVGGESIAGGDFDGDGNQDLVVVQDSSGQISLLLGDGMGGFAMPDVNPYGNRLDVVTLARVDGDMRDDLIVVDSGDDVLAIFSGNSAGTLGTPLEYPIANNAEPPVVFDADFDGLWDVGLGDVGQGISLYLGAMGGGLQQAPLRILTGGHVDDFRVADFSGDGHPDIVSRNNNGLAITLSNP